jgi:glutathione S-transferase
VPGSLKLYDNVASVAAQKVRMTLHEKGQSWETASVDLRNGDVMNADYLQLNPGGVVPTLIHDGRPYIESTAIIEYLDEVFPEPPLKPATPAGRHRMRLWTKRIDEEVHKATGPLSQAVYIRYAHLDKTPEQLDAYFARLPDKDREARQRSAIRLGLEAPEIAPALRCYSRLIDDIEAQAAAAPWLTGEAFSLADIAVAPYLARMEMLVLEALWADGRRPNAARWWTAMKARPCYKMQVQDKFPEAMRTNMLERGKAAWPKIKEMLKL